MNIKNFVFFVVVSAIFTGCSPNFQPIINDWFSIGLPRVLSFLMPLIIAIFYFVRFIKSKWYIGLLIAFSTHFLFVGLLMMFIIRNEVSIDLVEILKVFYFIR